MEVLEEENPLQIDTKSNKDAGGFKNNVGRPTRKHEILFSAPPKSIISILLREEKNEKPRDDQNEIKLLKEKTVEIEKIWTCQFCSERIFNKKSEYKKHLKTHQIYKCDYTDCLYATKFISNLKTHKRTHTSEYPYVCDQCIFRTKFINSLKTHKRLHDKVRPFECQHCEYKCNSGSNLKKHCTRKHSIITNNNG